jgi:LasA protease
MKIRPIVLVVILMLLLAACVRPQTSMSEQLWSPANATQPPTPIQAAPSQISTLPAATGKPISSPTLTPEAPATDPTQDPPHIVPTLRTNTENYKVVAGDSLAKIAQRFQVDVNTIASFNQITNPNLLKVGQALIIPPPAPKLVAPDFKIIPDSELVFGPSTKGFDVAAFVRSKNGYLASYQEKVDDTMLTGAQIVDRVSREHSVNPRLLLAVLEYQGGWVLSKNPGGAYVEYPMGFFDHSRNGLYKQLFWAGNMLNSGFYGWQQGEFGGWSLTDGSLVRVSATVNAGTAAVQYLMSLLRGPDTWNTTVSKDGVFRVYRALFGYPFDFTYEPLVPTGLKQPAFQLPIQSGVIWYFTGGPHMGWDTGSPWAALDFAPEDAGSCNVSSAWETAVASGIIVRSGYGSVVLDLDGDGLEQTGWTVLYLHVATQDRVAAGMKVAAGDPIGHPSCEGGYAPATHLHIARRYNGVWIVADGSAAFVMDGWRPESAGTEYDGYLKKDGQVVEAWDGRAETNKIQR